MCASSTCVVCLLSVHFLYKKERSTSSEWKASSAEVRKNAFSFFSLSFFLQGREKCKMCTGMFLRLQRLCCLRSCFLWRQQREPARLKKLIAFVESGRKGKPTRLNSGRNGSFSNEFVFVAARGGSSDATVSPRPMTHELNWEGPDPTGKLLDLRTHLTPNAALPVPMPERSDQKFGTFSLQRDGSVWRTRMAGPLCFRSGASRTARLRSYFPLDACACVPGHSAGFGLLIMIGALDRRAIYSG